MTRPATREAANNPKPYKTFNPQTPTHSPNNPRRPSLKLKEVVLECMERLESSWSPGRCHLLDQQASGLDLGFRVWGFRV